MLRAQDRMRCTEACHSAKPGESWKKDRFRAPYLRDFLLDHGFAIDTMETAFSWSKLEAATRGSCKPWPMQRRARRFRLCHGPHLP